MVSIGHYRVTSSLKIGARPAHVYGAIADYQRHHPHIVPREYFRRLEACADFCRSRGHHGAAALTTGGSVKRIGLSLLVSVGMWLHPSPATAVIAAENSTPAERSKAVRIAHELEADPFAADAPEKRRWLLTWYERIPDITVNVCNLLGPLPDDHPFLPEVLVHTAFSGGAFMIEHPDQLADQVAVQTAGLLGALKVYEAFASRTPGKRLPFIEGLVAKRDKGTLTQYMKDTVPTACKSE